jgi:hypothetical protein
MKNIWPVSLGLPLILAVAIDLASCGGAPNSSPAYTNSSPATLAYVFGVESGTFGMLTYSTAPANNASPVAGVRAAGQEGPIATDSAGQIYIGGNDPADPLNPGEILVYPPSSTGNDHPSRTINLSFFPNRLAVDPAGRTYVLNLPDGWTTGALMTVSIYAADASGPAEPLRTIVLTNVVPIVTDMVADAAGNLYVAAVLRNSNHWNISVYPPTANGPSTPARTIDFGPNGLAWVYGVGVDSKGDIFASVCAGCYEGASTIEEFAPEAQGAAVPVKTINLTAGSLGQINAGGPVRVDGAGNIFTSLAIWPPGLAPGPLNVFYGFAPDATGDAVPTVQFTPPQGGTNGWLALN